MPWLKSPIAGVAQLVERQLPKLNVEGSNPFARFGGDGWRGCGGKCAARNRAGGQVGGLLGRTPRNLQLNQPDGRPALSAVHSNTSMAACFAARVRSVLWRTLCAIPSTSWAAYALKLLCRKGCVGVKNSSVGSGFVTQSDSLWSIVMATAREPQPQEVIVFRMRKRGNAIQAAPNPIRCVLQYFPHEVGAA